MATFTDHAICLRLVDWSETSQIAVLLTREHGKVSATAKGAKRQTPSVMARFSGGLELATLGEAVLITRSGRDLANLIEWNLLEGHWTFRRDLRAFDRAMYAIDLAHHLTHDHDPHPRSFAALAELLKSLDERGGAAGDGGARALLRFQWTLIDDAGYRPVLDRDAASGRPIDRRGVHAFSASAGGLVGDAADAWKVRRETIELLRALDTGDAIDGADPTTVERANRLLCVYCRAILDKQLPTMTAILGR